MELTLLIIIAVSVIALIYITMKSNALEKEGDTETSDTTGSGGATNKNNDTKTGKEKTSGPQQNTIYEFSPKAETRLCPFCDGENNAGSKVCDICGRSI